MQCSLSGVSVQCEVGRWLAYSQFRRRLSVHSCFCPDLLFLHLCLFASLRPFASAKSRLLPPRLIHKEGVDPLCSIILPSFLSISKYQKSIKYFITKEAITEHLVSKHCKASFSNSHQDTHFQDAVPLNTPLHHGPAPSTRLSRCLCSRRSNRSSHICQRLLSLPIWHLVYLPLHLRLPTSFYTMKYEAKGWPQVSILR